MTVTDRFRSLALIVGCFCSSSSAWDGWQQEEDEVRVVIGLSQDSARFRVQSKVHGTVQNSIQRAHAVTMTMPQSRVELLRDDPAVEYFYEDGLVYPMVENDGEEMGWAIPFIDADNTFIPQASPKQHNNENCFKVCIVDGGLQTSHPDIPFEGPADHTIEGRTFNLPLGQTWWDPRYHHGTHVAGVVGDASNICLLVARVFGDDGSGQNDSVVLEAVEWCADRGASIINLSLGSPHSGTPAAKAVYDRILEDDETLVISASGNSYTTEYNYPASWPDVLSVGAVDQDGMRASFSNHNDRVNIAAPGVEIKSTAPISAIIDDDTGKAREVRFMQQSEIPDAFLGELHECGDGVVDSDFAGSAGKICIAQRGSITFQEKAELCEARGCIGLVVVNNENGALAGTLGEESNIRIPVVGASQVDGAILRTYTWVTLTAKAPGYSKRSGTSMAVPFVSGVAAKIWAARPECTASQVREAILSSADKESLLAPDMEEFRNSYGEGLVQAEGAYLALMQNPPPCGGTVENSVPSTPEQSGSNGNTDNIVDMWDEVETQTDQEPEPIFLNWDSERFYNEASIELHPESQETPSPPSAGKFFDDPHQFGSPTTGFLPINLDQPDFASQNSIEDPQDGNSSTFPALEDAESSRNATEDSSVVHNATESTTPDVSATEAWVGWYHMESSYTPSTTSNSNSSSAWIRTWRWVSGDDDRRHLRSSYPNDEINRVDETFR